MLKKTGMCIDQSQRVRLCSGRGFGRKLMYNGWWALVQFTLSHMTDNLERQFRVYCDKHSRYSDKLNGYLKRRLSLWFCLIISVVIASRRRVRSGVALEGKAEWRGDVQQHVQQGQVGRGQFGGRLYAWLSQQRRASDWRGFAAEVPVREAGVSGTVTGRGGMLGWSCGATHPNPQRDEEVTMGNWLRRVSLPWATFINLHYAWSLFSFCRSCGCIGSICCNTFEFHMCNGITWGRCWGADPPVFCLFFCRVYTQDHWHGVLRTHVVLSCHFTYYTLCVIYVTQKARHGESVLIFFKL